jgi:hypothetical protein
VVACSAGMGSSTSKRVTVLTTDVQDLAMVDRALELAMNDDSIANMDYEIVALSDGAPSEALPRMCALSRCRQRLEASCIEGLRICIEPTEEDEFEGAWVVLQDGIEIPVHSTTVGRRHNRYTVDAIVTALREYTLSGQSFTV